MRGDHFIKSLLGPAMAGGATRAARAAVSLGGNGWTEALERNDWTPALLTGDAFAQFVARDTAALRQTMTRAGIVS